MPSFVSCGSGGSDDPLSFFGAGLTIRIICPEWKYHISLMEPFQKFEEIQKILLS